MATLPGFVWLVMQERTGSTWLASSVLAQHPQIDMLSDGACEACWGFFDPTKWGEFREGALLRSALAQHNVTLRGALPTIASIGQMRGWSRVRWRGGTNGSSQPAAGACRRKEMAWCSAQWPLLFEAVSEVASSVCIAQLGSLLGRCEARPSTHGQPRKVCGWKAPASFCPTDRCEAFVWGALRPKILRLYRRDVLRQATSLALAERAQTWSCPQRCNKKGGGPKKCGSMYRSYSNIHRDVMVKLAYLFDQRGTSCGYLRKHMPHPWLQFAYEDLAEPQLRNRTVAHIYAALAVDDTWSAWRDVQRRQSHFNQTVIA
jgi:hypothetical protein